MVVQQHVLNWLYSVLTSEYRDVNRTYNDVAQALSQYPSLSPRTDVHTFPNGTSALLLHLSGTIPVIFRGTTYHFPISLWVPHAYPREAPLVYVTPTDNIVVRPGQHVDPQGQVYHPYLVGWSSFSDISTILDFLAILRDIFASQPPVISKQQSRSSTQQPPQQGPRSQQPAAPPPVPPLPPDLTERPTSTNVRPQFPQDQAGPPLLPPKPAAHPPAGVATAVSRQTDGPPAPPLPPNRPDLPVERRGSGQQPSRYDSAPPLPPQGQPPPRQPYSTHVANPPTAQPPYQPAPNQTFNTSPPVQAPTSYALPQPYGPPPPGWPPQQFPPTQQPTSQQAILPYSRGAPAAAQPHRPPPDLLDEPLTLNIPSPSSVPAPPIPPNPEKDALLHQLAAILYAIRQRSRAQNESSLAGLQAQRTAMLMALATMQSELSSLSQLSTQLQSNTGILHDALRRADAVIEGSRAQKPPPIDELLVAPTVVAQQLYDLVAEERALADAIFVLGRAVERGRVSPAVFAKTTRSLAREWYLKKALVRKIAVGMGLLV